MDKTAEIRDNTFSVASPYTANRTLIPKTTEGSSMFWLVWLDIILESKPNETNPCR